MKSILTTLLTLIFCLLALSLGQADSATELRARLAELDKLHQDKVVTDAEYEAMRKEALQKFGNSGASVAAAESAKADLSTPVKAVEAFQRAWNAKDHAALVRTLTGDLKKQIAGASPEAIEHNFSHPMNGTIGEAQGIATKEGREQCTVPFTSEAFGKPYTQHLELVKEGDDWLIAGGLR
jgi:hypothetical protein